MKKQYTHFVIFAEMRTGSNFLEENINAFEGLKCCGEAFNPHFVGGPQRADVLGVTLEQREKNPLALLDAIKDAPGIAGFRYFHDHDPRVAKAVLDDRSCAKIILSRNPVESYISLKIARATGQWKLTNVTHQKTAKVLFDADEFNETLRRTQSFRHDVVHQLQLSGQTAFSLDYEDIRNVEVMNGLAQFLGVEERLDGLSKQLKKQNPSSLLEKVANPSEMREALGNEDYFGLLSVPNYEPVRNAGVNRYVAAAKVPLLFLPMPSGPNKRVKNWLRALGGGELREKLTQNDLRQWKLDNTGHRSFTVVRHPVARAHEAFCQTILNHGPRAFPKIRESLKRVHNVPLPDDPTSSDYDLAAHRAAFLGFLKFLKANLAGQTAIRNDMAWSSQASMIEAYAGFAAPDMILREDTLETDLEYLAYRMGHENIEIEDEPAAKPYALDDIYDADIESAAQEAYKRDYVTFGFGAWRD
ncbi:nodulation protein NodH [Falsihalocynthiibacter sp. SS001]|uniref:nodulation protein NodH n=1 Tax=Falsihalocynthiibacter sp. SS001 TaxID=3349698 RepID=UPI0036D256CB